MRLANTTRLGGLVLAASAAMLMSACTYVDRGPTPAPQATTLVVPQASPTVITPPAAAPTVTVRPSY